MNEITEQRAKEFGIEVQREGESDSAFRHRVSGEIRKKGHIIEAHEAMQNKLYNDPDGGDVMGGIFGAVAQAMQGNPYGKLDGEQQVGTDIAAGIVAKQPKRSGSDDAMLMLLMAMMDKR